VDVLPIIYMLIVNIYQQMSLMDDSLTTTGRLAII